MDRIMLSFWRISASFEDNAARAEAHADYSGGDCTCANGRGRLISSAARYGHTLI
jgi:hypothetical protein